MIEPLNLPKANLRLKKKNRRLYVWCIIRKRELICTPEEWVRQHFIHYLVNYRKVPIGLISSEFSLKYNGILKRADIVVFKKNTEPILIVECKAPNIILNQKTIFQIAQYNFTLNAKYLCLTNGLDHCYCQINTKNGSINNIDEIPLDLVD